MGEWVGGGGVVDVDESKVNLFTVTNYDSSFIRKIQRGSWMKTVQQHLLKQ